MASIETPAVHQVLTGSGTTAGVIPVTSTTGFKVGAQGWLRGPLGSPASQFAKISEIVDATHLALVFIPEGINDVKLRTGAVKFPTSQRSDCSSYPINSTFDMFQQVVALPPIS